MARKKLTKRQGMRLLKRKARGKGGRFGVLRTLQVTRLAADDLGMRRLEFLRAYRRAGEDARGEYDLALADAAAVVKLDIAVIMQIFELILEFLEKLFVLFD
jgi:hypothetical protein